MNDDYWRAQVAVTRHFTSKMNDAIALGFNAEPHPSLYELAEQLADELSIIAEETGVCAEWAARYGSKP